MSRWEESEGRRLDRQASSLHARARDNHVQTHDTRTCAHVARAQAATADGPFHVVACEEQSGREGARPQSGRHAWREPCSHHVASRRVPSSSGDALRAPQAPCRGGQAHPMRAVEWGGALHRVARAMTALLSAARGMLSLGCRRNPRPVTRSRALGQDRAPYRRAGASLVAASGPFLAWTR